MKRSRIKIIAAVMSILLLVPIGIYGYFVVYAQDYREVWEPVKKSSSAKKSEETATTDTAKQITSETEPETSEVEAGSGTEAETVTDTQAASTPKTTAAPAAEAVSSQPAAVIVGERKKDVTPKTADFGVEDQYLICMVLALAGISILLLSVGKGAQKLHSKPASRTPEKRRWEKAWEESKRLKNA